MTTFRQATQEDIPQCKHIIDEERNVFGFVIRAALEDAVKSNSLIVAVDGEGIVGFVRYRIKKRIAETVIYEIVVARNRREEGIGRSLVELVLRAKQDNIVIAKCPVGEPANVFYQRVGFRLLREEEGRKRKLNVWMK